MHRWLPCLVLLFGACIARAQDAASSFGFGMAAHSGFIVPHSRELIDVSGSRPFGFELDAEWLYAGEAHTLKSGAVYRRGIALYAFDFNEPDVLGGMLAVTPYVEPMIRAQDRLHGSIRLGIGLALLSRPYDAESNPTNLFYSTTVSFMAMANAYLGWRLSPRWELKAGFNFNHTSNGGMRQPNKGMNFPTWSLGAAYSLAPVQVGRPVRDDAWRARPRRTLSVLGSASMKNTPMDDAQDLEQCWILGGMGTVGHRLGRLTGLAAGTEWVHDGFAREMAERTGTATNAWRGAMVLGPELLAGRATFSVLFGAYVYSPGWNGDPLYQRYQLACTLGSHWMLAASLKAHRHVADVMDLRVGWAW